MGELPAGTVTFLVTDVVGSTALWERHGDSVRGSLAFHDEVLGQLSSVASGVVFQRAGDGAYAVFRDPTNALDVAKRLQARLMAAELETPIDVRVGIHTGDAEPSGGEYLGPSINRAVRVCDAAHGGQILLSEDTARIVSGVTNTPIVAVGEYWLKGIADPQPLHQLGDGRFPPPRSAAVAEVVLPSWPTPLVGRTREVAEVTGLLGDHSLVTVVGIGGIGKTRVAVAAAGRAASLFPDGVWFVDLTLVGSSDDVRDALARTLGLHGGAVQGSAALDSAAFLENRRALLVLDNCEHVLRGAAVEAGRLLARCPDLRVLATSRESLRTTGERTVALEPLNPDSDALDLFVDRAREANPAFRGDSGARTAIAGVCERLDGIPLAIELAAARCRHIKVSELVEALGHRFDVLTGGDPVVPRHETLEATLDWSHDLLAEDEQVLLRRLSIFPQPFTFDAARAVAGELADRTLSSLGHLVDQSLVVFQSDGRYRLLDTVRSYASRKLASAGEVDATALLHREWVLDLCRRYHPVDTSIVADAEQNVLPDEANLVQALRLSLQRDELGVAADLSRFVWGVLQCRGELDWAAEVYGRALRERWSPDADIHADMAALTVLAEIWTGDLSDPDPLIDEVAAPILAAPNPERGFAVGAMLQAAVHLHRHDVDRAGALALLDQATELAEKSGSTTLLQAARTARAATHMNDRSYGSALAIVEQPGARPITTAQGTRVGALYMLGRHHEALDALESVDERQRRGSEFVWATLELMVRSAIGTPDVRARAAGVHRRTLGESPSPVTVRWVAASLAVILFNLDEPARARHLAELVRGVVTIPGLNWVFEAVLLELGLPSPPAPQGEERRDMPKLAGRLDETLRWLEDTAELKPALSIKSLPPGASADLTAGNASTGSGRW